MESPSNRPPAAAPAGGDTWLGRSFAILSLLGGVALLSLGFVVTTSVVSRWFGFGGVAGDFEIVQMLTALSIFAFLPLCQFRRGHIFVDSFTGRMRPRARAVLDALWDGVAMLAMGFIAWRMALGGLESIRSQTVTMVLSFPLGWVILGAALLAGLTAVAAILSALRVWRA